jgi:hypothetical protein
MNDRDRRVYEMSLRALGFLTANVNDLKNIPAVAAATTLLQTETPILGELGMEKVSTTGEALDATIHKGDRRDALRDALQDIAGMWRPMAKNYENAQNKFRMPNGSDQLMIDTAGSFAADAAPIEADFIARGMPAGFVADLTAKKVSFSASVNESDAAKMERVGANAGFPSPVKQCREAVEDIDPIIKMVYRTNPSKLAEWLTASHVERAAKRTTTPTL